MYIKECKGYELEKALPNTSEDYFNRSEVTYIEDGTEKTLHVLYVRYFETLMDNFTPFQEDPIFQVGSRDIYLKDTIAIVSLIQNPGNRHRKRIYINTEKEFSGLFQNVDFEKLKLLFQSVEQNKGFELQSPLEFIVQPQ